MPSPSASSARDDGATTDPVLAHVLRLRNVSKRYGGVRALRDVDFDVRAGEVHCLAGENGSGKSTLIKIISGAVAPDPGSSVEIAGEPVAHLTPRGAIRAGIQIIYQDFSLFPTLSVAENIAVEQHLTPAIHLVSRARMMTTARAAMTRIGISLNLDAPVSSLSIASRQLVAVCRAIAAEARLLIMDEPTASLTRHEVDQLLGVVGDLKRRGVAVVFVSHRLDEVMKVADRVTVLRDGAKLDTWPARDLDPGQLSVLMTGKEFRYDAPAQHPVAAPTLSVKGLTRRGQFSDVSFDIFPGEILGLTGMLGAGRTELALSLFGMNPPVAGEVRLGGDAFAPKSNRAAIARGVAYLSEDRLTTGLVMSQSVWRNGIASVLGAVSNGAGWLRLPRADTVVRKLVGDLSIKVADTALPVQALSGGNQQRVALGKWLAAGPRVLILDSPTVGVDVNAKDGIYQVIRHLAREGMAILLISDELPEILAHTHRVLAMRDGRIVDAGRTRDTSEDRLRSLISG